MVDKLGVHEFMVLTAGGAPIFHFSKDQTRKLDELLSGFLSAITSFATEFGEKSIQSLSFEGSELLYEQFGPDYLFIFLVETGSSEKVLRVVLRELSKRFVSRYENEMRMDIPILDVFMDFENDVRAVLSYYEGILIVMSSLSAFIIPQVKKDNLDIAIRTGGFLDEFHRDLGNSGNRVLSAIDGKTSLYNIGRSLGLSEIDISDVVEYLAIRGLLRVSKLCPLIQEKDARFDAYLDIIGLPSKDYQLLERAKSLCNGNRSLMDISERLGVVPEQLYEVLEKLGDEVEWRLVEVSALVDEL
ncbi:MAG: hypothetical protein ThorAB25_07200 [Candidatus Thorarchaeota archaeon AB_25]|nr:MAG: hypothetical protein ThorAB25_07200 [Candidatus Thorarchaeota archaeon AB_25]